MSFRKSHGLARHALDRIRQSSRETCVALLPSSVPVCFTSLPPDHRPETMCHVSAPQMMRRILVKAILKSIAAGAVWKQVSFSLP